MRDSFCRECHKVTMGKEELFEDKYFSITRCSEVVYG